MKLCMYCKKECVESEKNFGRNYVNPTFFHYDCIPEGDVQFEDLLLAFSFEDLQH